MKTSAALPQEMSLEHSGLVRYLLVEESSSAFAPSK